MKHILAVVFLMQSSVAVQPSLAAAENPWASIRFLEGTWEARSSGGGAGAKVSGSYTFKRELKDRILARHSDADATCKGPKNFDCDHSDLLYVFQEIEGHPLKGIYFDNEGHVIHYDVSAPAPNTVIFLSPESAGPQFRLVYELNDSVMSGKFQMRMPGQADWKSYLEWAGSRKK